jgi:hypothetical protein
MFFLFNSMIASRINICAKKTVINNDMSPAGIEPYYFLPFAIKVTGVLNKSALWTLFDKEDKNPISVLF